MRRVALVLASRTEVVMARRRPEGLFGALWEPPTAAGWDPAYLARSLQVDPGKVAPSGRVVHVLSHRRMEVAVVRGGLGRRRRWLTPRGYDAIEVVRIDALPGLAHSALARKVLAVAGVLVLAKAARRGLRFPG